MLIAMAVYDTEQNGRTCMTKATLDSLARAVDWDRHRLFIIDNGSCERTLALYAEVAKKVLLPFHLIKNELNVGTAKAINQAWRHRRPGEHACKMDNDVVIHQRGWADWMADVFSRDPSIGICGLKRKDLSENPFDGTSTIRMLPHRGGQRWIVVEDVRHVMGTCQGYNCDLLEKIGYLTQPGVYGFDDSLAAVRSRVIGYKSVFLHGFEIDHIDPGGDNFTAWKRQEAENYFPAYNALVLLYETGAKDVYDDGL